MTWRIEFDEHRKVIFLTFQAEVSKEDVRDSSAAVIATMHDHDTRKVLTDLAEVESLAVSTMGIYHLPKSYMQMGLNLPFTEAIVVPKSSKIRKDAEFYETVCVNRGVNARIFEDRDQALEWLTLSR
jgi:hypothetical protein